MLSNRTFDILKWVCLVVLPACASLYMGISKIWQLPFEVEIPQTITVIDAFLGALLGVSTIKYMDDTQTHLGE